ncbi:ComEC/Rec2 family competence protein [Pseudoduganella sp. RAF53_2]|uniref:ComEC/Rec2 family competence protein n=1 Tax=unclassified Pseudoduganella TaxID=2637179 RepID=UPI003F97F8CC
MPGEMVVRIFDVEHGQCAMIAHHENGQMGALAMVDCGCTANWRPSAFIKNVLRRERVDYLFITNADQDHMSDLDGLWEAGVDVSVLFRNSTYTADQIRAIKRESGPLSRDAERYASMAETFNADVSRPFNESMGGITVKTFRNSYPEFEDTNNLSLVAFFEFAGWVILFPGDLEVAGWRALLKNAEFCRMLKRTNIFVASHHGRQSGFCDEVFNHANPDAFVISDKSKVHTTQETLPDYRNVVDKKGLFVRTTGKTRHVLTTRRDGTITFRFFEGNFTVDTETRG